MDSYNAKDLISTPASSEARVRNKKIEYLLNKDIQKRQIDLAIFELDEQLKELAHASDVDDTISQQRIVQIREKFFHLSHFIRNLSIVKFAASHKPGDKTPLIRGVKAKWSPLKKATVKSSMFASPFRMQVLSGYLLNSVKKKITELSRSSS